MIKILTCQAIAAFTLELKFSNGESGVFDAKNYLAEKRGSLLDALRDASFFQRCFIDAGALCWPNGLELSGQRVFELSRILAAH